MLDTSDLVGGLWIPTDGVANPNLICSALMTEAAKMGVKIVENCAVTEVLQANKKVEGVNTSRGYIDCDYFVNCAGFWARNVGQLSSPCVKIPIHAAEHYTLQTQKIENLDAMTPIIRDLDGQTYIREFNGGFLAGGYELEAKPAFQDDNFPSKKKNFTHFLTHFKIFIPISASSDSREATVDWDHFYPLLQQILKRVPLLKNTYLENLTNGPEAFSPDCKWILGEAPEVK